ncbi:MAG: UDP-N-acetylmuramate dehydrogenase [Candidatus Falkowbacteria bacterium]
MEITSKIQKNIPLAQMTTFKIGGPAKFYLEAKNKEDLAGAIEWAKKNKEEIFILAGGSNVLINDNGINGLVVKINNDEIIFRGDRIECGAGANLTKIVRQSAGKNLSGLEWAINIPGTIGGAVRGNAGAYGSSIMESVETVEIFNIKKKKFIILSNKDCKFDYRESIFKHNNENEKLVWQIILKLNNGNSQEINELINKYSDHRQKNQPKLPSAGCVFKNFNVNDLRRESPKIVNLINEAENQGKVKNNMIGAGWVIDNLLDLKGKKIGDAKVSLEHANFIVNTGKATSEDVITLISFIKQQARSKFNIQLQEEIQYLGF